MLWVSDRVAVADESSLTTELWRFIMVVFGWLLDVVCRVSGHRLCHTWVGRKSYEWVNGGK